MNHTNRPRSVRRAVRRGRVSLIAMLIVVAVAALAVACGDDDDDDDDDDGTPVATTVPSTATRPPAATSSPASSLDAGDDAVDACALITQEEAEEILGGQAEQTRTDTPPLYDCTYEEVDGFNSVGVLVTVHPDEDEAASFVDDVVERNDYAEIDGLGDRAYNSQPFFDVSVLKGRYEIDIDVNRVDPEADLETAKELAQTVLDRLP